MSKPKTKAATIKRKTLAAATTASVKAALLGIPALRDRTPPGTLTGFFINDKDLRDLGRAPEELAAEIAKNVKASSGIPVRAHIIRVPGGVLTGFLPPSILR